MGKKELQRQFIPASRAHGDASKPTSEAEYPPRWWKNQFQPSGLTKTRVQIYKWAFFPMWLDFKFCPPCSPGQHGETSGGWMISCKQNCRRCVFGEVFLERECLKKNMSLKRRDTTEFVWSTIMCCHTSLFNSKPSIHSLGLKMWQNVCVETMDLFLVPQMLDFTGNCWQLVYLIPVLSHFSSEDVRRVVINLILVFPFLNKILGKKMKVLSHQASKEALVALTAEIQVGQRVGWSLKSSKKKSVWRAAALKPGSGIYSYRGTVNNPSKFSTLMTWNLLENFRY